MVTQKQIKKQAPDLSHLPFTGADQAGVKWLIAAVLAAGKDGCECDSCKLLKKFGGELSGALLKEENNG